MSVWHCAWERWCGTAAQCRKRAKNRPKLNISGTLWHIGVKQRRVRFFSIDAPLTPVFKLGSCQATDLWRHPFWDRRKSCFFLFTDEHVLVSQVKKVELRPRDDLPWGHDIEVNRGQIPDLTRPMMNFVIYLVPKDSICADGKFIKGLTCFPVLHLHFDHQRALTGKPKYVSPDRSF